MLTNISSSEKTELYERIIETARDVIYVISPQGVIEILNPMFRTITGWDIEDWLGKSFVPLIHESDQALAFEMTQKVLRGDNIPLFNLRIRCKNGNLINGEFLSYPIKKDGKIVKIIGIARDITNRISLTEKIQILTKAVEQAPLSIVITDNKAKITFVNPKFTQITGYTSEEAIGKNPRILKSGKVNPLIYRELWSAILAGKTWKGDLINRKKDNSLYQEQAIISPIMNDLGQTTHFIAIKEDVTLTRIASEELIKRTEELEKMNKLMIGRELKMAELKKELENLKNK